MTNLPMTLPNHSSALLNPGALGSIESYISAVNRIPMLTAEQEKSLAEELQYKENLDAARQLIMSHLRLVVSISRQYLGYGLPHADLIQEGNIGLMKAVKRYDVTRGVRLMSFAVHWIKAEIHEYIIRNWRLVKIATTKAQRKLFFNLRSMRPDSRTLEPESIQGIASKLNVRPEDVAEMEVRLTGHDMAFESSSDDEEDYSPANYLSDEGEHEPTNVLARQSAYEMQTQGVQDALKTLDERSRHIIEARWLHDDKAATLHELAAQYGVSAERIRQIESAALKKMRKALAQNM
ncbi:RNA polymerase sigma factor RpoH [Brackiella oedipodis]|uniref:RNA polymerase sigma factor RpoH n=1 Tax=Brackiella oedipodis TaxID=124225 RepID=UPI000570DE0F|nr:RNA polymerase sigma factor RpoH [Brackiella oedipodis]